MSDTYKDRPWGKGRKAPKYRSAINRSVKVEYRRKLRAPENTDTRPRIADRWNYD